MCQRSTVFENYDERHRIGSIHLSLLSNVEDRVQSRRNTSEMEDVNSSNTDGSGKNI